MEKIRIDLERAREWLGPRRFPGEVRKRTADPGVATGLAVTAVGGDVLFIEATAYPGNGTAQGHGTARRGDAGVGPGRVLVGAARMPMARRRSRVVRKNDIHVHVPAGAVPKDGPSAGVTMATAIVSLVKGEPVSERVGMTGEITLTGQVLQIGGLREKVLAAQRAGIEKIILPRENEADLADLPEESRSRWSSCSPTRSKTCSQKRSRTRRRGRAAAPASDRRRQRLRRSPAGTRIGVTDRKEEHAFSEEGVLGREALCPARGRRRRSARQPQGRVLRGQGHLRRALRRARPARRRSACRDRREIHENLKKISDDLRKSVDRVQGKADHTGRNLFLLLTGVLIGVLFNPISGPRPASG